MTMLGMWQIHNGNDRASRVRGRAVYDEASSLGVAVKVGSELVTTRQELSQLSRLQVQLINPASADAVRFVDGLRQITNTTVLVDVTFPFGDVASYIGALPRDDPFAEWDDEVTRSFWTDPEHVRMLTMAIERADAVSTPFEDWSDRLRGMNDRVFVIPDLIDQDDPVQVHRFAVQLHLAHNPGGPMWVR